MTNRDRDTHPLKRYLRACLRDGCETFYFLGNVALMAGLVASALMTLLWFVELAIGRLR